MLGLWDHLERLSAYDVPLEELRLITDFDMFRPTLLRRLRMITDRRGGAPTV